MLIVFLQYNEITVKSIHIYALQAIKNSYKRDISYYKIRNAPILYTAIGALIAGCGS